MEPLVCSDHIKIPVSSQGREQPCMYVCKGYQLCLILRFRYWIFEV